MCCAAFLLAFLVPAFQDTAPAPAPLRAVLVGRATDESGRPLPGVGVAAGPADTILTADALERPQARTDAEGRFAVAIPDALLAPGSASPAILWAAPGRVALRMCDEFFGSSLPGPSPCPETIEVGVLRMFPGTDLRGQVRGPDGQGIGGARVRVLDLLAWRDRGPLFSRFLRDVEYGGTQSGQPGSFATTRADGSFVVRCVPSAGLVVHVSAPGFLDRVVQAVATDAPAEIQLVKSGFVTGRVTDARGKGEAASLFVRYETDQEVLASDGTRGMPDLILVMGNMGMSPASLIPAQFVRTEADGSFRVPVRFAGLFRLCAVPSGATRQIDSRLLTGPRDGFELVLPDPGTAGVQLRFVDRATRKPVPGVASLVVWRGSDYPNLILDNGLAASRVFGLARSDMDGNLRLRMPESGALSGLLRAFAPPHAPVGGLSLWFDGTAMTPVTAELVRPARLEGRVRDEDTDEPVAGAEVECRLGESGPILGRARCGADGAFEIDGLCAGQLHVEVRHGDRIAAGSVTLADEEIRGMTWSLPAGRRVAVQCQGTLSPDAWLQLERGRMHKEWNGVASLRFQRVREVRPPAEGPLVLASLSPGSYRLRVAWPGPTMHQPPLVDTVAEFAVTDADLETTADLAARAPGMVAGKVRVAGARLPPGRCVVVALPGDVAEFFDRYFMVWAMAGARTCQIGRDGGFRLSVSADTPHRLCVVDGMTGITLSQEREPIQLAAGASAERQLDVTVASVPVAVTGDQAQLLGLQFETEQQGASWRPAEAHLWLGDGTRAATVLLPPGPVTVRTTTSAWRALSWSAGASRLQRAELQTRGELELSVEPGVNPQRQIALPPRPPLPYGPRAR